MGAGQSRSNADTINLSLKDTKDKLSYSSSVEEDPMDFEFISALMNKDINKLKLLIQRGANPNTTTGYGSNQTAMNIAFGKDDFEFAKLLIKKGFNTDMTVSASSMANRPDYNKYTTFLLENKLVKSPEKLIWYETLIKNPELFNFLMQTGVSIDNPVYYAGVAESRGDKELAKLILRKVKDGKSPGALIPAIKLNDINMVRRFLNDGADPTAHDSSGNLPLGYVENNKDIKNLLIQYGAKPDKYSLRPDELLAIEQKDFASSLSDSEKSVLGFYTGSGYKIINGILRGNLYIIPPENKELNIELKNIKSKFPPDARSDIGFAKQLLVEMLNIAKKAPKLTKEITVYRGVKKFEDIQGHGNEFLSTSTDRQLAEQRFASSENETSENYDIKNPNPGCCVLTIILKPGIRAIAMNPFSIYGDTEREVLVCPPFELYTDRSLDFRSKEFFLTIRPKTPYRRNAGRRTYKRKKNGKKTRKFTSY